MNELSSTPQSIYLFFVFIMVPSEHTRDDVWVPVAVSKSFEYFFQDLEVDALNSVCTSPQSRHLPYL